MTRVDPIQGELVTRPWSVPEWRRQCRERDEAQDATSAQNGYFYANLGGVVEHFGWPWPWCPAWFAEHASDALKAYARSAMRAARWKANNAIGCVLEGQPTPQFVRAIETCEVMIRHLQAEQAKREAKQ